MGRSADAYVIWIQYKKDLEELCNKKEEYQHILEKERTSSPRFSSAQADLVRYTLAQSAVKTTLQVLGTSDQHTLYTAAEDALTSLCNVVQNRYTHFERQGAAINAMIMEYTTLHEPQEQDTLFCKTLALCSDYASIANINETLLNKKISKNQLYIDIGELSFLANTQLRKDFLMKETKASTAIALEYLQQEVNTFIEKEQTIRRKLLQKYDSKSLSVEERSFLRRPSSFYRLFAVSLQTACGNSKSYLNRKNDLHHESLALDECGRELQSAEPVLTQEYITKLLPSPYLPSSPLDSIVFLTPLAHHYTKKRDDLEAVIEQKKKRVIEKLERELHVLETYLTDILEKGENCSITDKLCYLSNCVDLAQKVGASFHGRMQEIHDILTRVEAYGTLGSTKVENVAPPAVERSFDQNNVVVESLAVENGGGNVEETECQNDNLERVVQKVSPFVSIDPSKGNSDLTGIPRCSIFNEENILLAFRSISQVTDSSLRALCCRVAGYDGQNLSLHTAAERSEMRFSAIEVEHLNDKDREIFNLLIASLEEE